MKAPVFIVPVREYPSYADLFRLIALAGYRLATPADVNLDDPEETYIFTGPEGIPDVSHARARCIMWQFEYRGDYSDQPNWPTCREVWGSDPGWCARNGAKFVLLGSDARLSFGAERHTLEYDIVMLSYMTNRRQTVRDALSRYRWPEAYPGHNTTARHNILLSSRLMLHVHQHDGEPRVIAPIRLALAAAYRLPVISEDVADHGPYDGAVRAWADHGALADITHAFLSAPPEAGESDGGLYDLLCAQHPFKQCVEEALA